MKQRIFFYPEKLAGFANRHIVLFHIVLSLLTCFIMEWLSRHSLISAYYFVTEHTGAYLYNSFVIFVIYSVIILVRRRTFLRMVLLAILMTFGIANCVILLNRVTPFGFTDLNMVTDLLTMQNTTYFTAQQGAICFAALVIYVVLMVFLFRHDKKQPVRFSFPVRLGIVAALFLSVPIVTSGLIRVNILTSYFGNLAQGYLDYGYVYGFATSMLDRGIKKPSGYTPTAVQDIVKETDMGASTRTGGDGPNIIIVLLESFFDVSEADFIKTSEDPIPFFHELEANYSTGHLTVPVVGAGTCNTEFEILTGMSCQFFGPGEYPQKTILKHTDVESVADTLDTLGFGTHVVHNNGGNFYSRANAFSMMGFDSFTCKEMLDITDYTPIGSWATDDILVGGTADALDSTPQSDFIYTITVEAHGDYPSEKVEENPDITVKCKGKDEELSNRWEYYTNRIHDVDEFLRDYVAMLDARDEDTLLICFGDHLPTMGLYDHEVATRDLYQTKYITWNNFGMEKEDADLTSYQLASIYLDRLGIHDGTVVDYNQHQTASGVAARSSEYMHGLHLLQYDLLYGKRYAYGSKDFYPASDIIMGSRPVQLDSAYRFDGTVHLYGDNFSRWSRVYVNGERVRAEYRSGQCLEVDDSLVRPGDKVVVNQVGSSNTIFRSSNILKYKG
ncbi:MAG: LTA synthase family protein [Lachnospiraceae bacterium]|nr:LTA synthase family protein [Lachnospiraceae bacterium]